MQADLSKAFTVISKFCNALEKCLALFWIVHVYVSSLTQIKKENKKNICNKKSAACSIHSLCASSKGILLTKSILFSVVVCLIFSDKQKTPRL